MTLKLSEATDIVETSAAVEQLPAVADAQQAVPSLMNFIASALENPAIDVSKLDALLRMQREVAAEDARAQFNRALHQAQSRMPRVKKNGTVDLGAGKGGYSFATFEDVDRIVRPILADCGLSVTFSSPVAAETGIVWTATHRHVAGHQESNSITLPPDTGAGRNALQARGSTNMYAKRYLVEDFYNIVREGADDDGVRGGTVYATEAQVDEIRELLVVTKSDVTRFRANFGINDETELDKDAAVRARNLLLQKKAQMGKRS